MELNNKILLANKYKGEFERGTIFYSNLIQHYL